MKKMLFRVALWPFGHSISGLSVLLLIFMCNWRPLDVAAASEQLNLTTSPLPILLTAKPGSTATADIRIKNNGPDTERLKIELYKFRGQGEAGDPALMERESGDDYFDWVSFSQPIIEALPNEWQTVKVSFNIPPHAAFGYYYAVTFIRADVPKPAPGQTVITGGTAVLVLLDVESPNSKRQAELLELKTDRRLYEFLPAVFSIKLRNTGNTHMAPRGNIFLSKKGKEVGVIEVNPDKGHILPESNRIFSVKWNDSFPRYVDKVKDGRTEVDQKGRPAQQLKWDLTQISKIRIGRYDAKLVMVYNNGQRDVPLEGTVSFWVLPWRLLGVIVLIVFFTIVGIIASQSRLRRGLRRKRR